MVGDDGFASWEEAQQVIVKVEYSALGLNVRFIVTNLEHWKWTVFEFFLSIKKKGTCFNFNHLSKSPGKRL